MNNSNKKSRVTFTQVTGMRERNLEMFETFWFVRLGVGEMWKNVVWKWRKCYGEVEEGDWDKNPVCKWFWKKDCESLSRLSVSEIKLATNTTLGYDSVLNNEQLRGAFNKFHFFQKDNCCLSG